MKFSDFKPDDVKILNIGDGKVGKTRLLGTLAALMPTILVTSDPNGLNTIKSMLGTEFSPLPETEVIIIRSWDEIWKCYEQVEALARTGKFKGLGLDDTTALQDTGLRKGYATPANGAEIHDGEHQRHVLQNIMEGKRRLQMQIRGNFNIGLDAFIFSLMELPVQVKMFTVLQEVHSHLRTGVDYLVPALEGGIKYQFVARFDLVINSFIHQDKDNNMLYCATSRPHSRISTGDRYKSGGRTWVNPTAQKLLAHVNGKGGVEDDIEKAIGVGYIAKETPQIINSATS